MAVAALVISISALVAGLLAIAWRVWGKPNLVIRFSSREVDGGRVMTCEFYNYPIVGRLKRSIGVRAAAIEDVMACFAIAEHGSKKVVYPGKVPDILRYDGRGGAQRMSLPVSIFPAHFGVASVSYDSKTVRVFEEDNVDLPVGKYIVRVQAQFGENSREAERTLVVHEEDGYAYWE
jgi:hypothetical protein